MNYYKRFPGDYQRDTADLSLLEHGAFTMLLDAYYANEAPLSADEAALFRVCRAFLPEEQDAVRRVCSRFFRRRSGRLYNDRADRQIRAEKEHSAAQRAKAEKRWTHEKCTKSARNSPEGAQAGSKENSDLDACAYAGAMPPTATASKEEDKRLGRAKARPDAGKRIPDDFELTTEVRAMADQALNGRNGVDVAFEFAKFTDYWRGIPGARGRKTDWPATWRNWIRKAVPNQPGAPHGQPPRRLSLAERTEADLRRLAERPAEAPDPH